MLPAHSELARRLWRSYDEVAGRTKQVSRWHLQPTASSAASFQQASTSYRGASQDGLGSTGSSVVNAVGLHQHLPVEVFKEPWRCDTLFGFKTENLINNPENLWFCSSLQLDFLRHGSHMVAFGRAPPVEFDQILAQLALECLSLLREIAAPSTTVPIGFE